VREAKVHTVWLKPDREYEEGFLEFLDKILDPEASGAFLASFRPFQRKVAFFGMFNSLSQTLLKIASPGIPDIYQGDELWDFSLVDPDNRRPVDYGLRMDLLKGIKEREAADLHGLLRDMLASPDDGRAKLFLIYRALKARAAQPSVFQYGEYLPLGSEGAHKDSVLAFARTFGKNWCVSIVPRFLTGFVPEGTPPLGRDIWGDTRIRIPGDAPVRWIDAVSGEQFQVENGSLAVGDAL